MLPWFQMDHFDFKGQIIFLLSVNWIKLEKMQAKLQKYGTFCKRGGQNLHLNWLLKNHCKPLNPCKNLINFWLLLSKHEKVWMNRSKQMV